jgi:diguanylate cyclase (GGDEF)-like protein
MLFEENVLRSIGEIDKALLYLRRTVESQQWENYQLAVISNDVLSEIIVQVAIIDAQGIMRASSAIKKSVITPIDLSDREHYRAHLNTAADRLFISRPVLGRASNKWSVQFTRRFRARDGSFGGVVVASLNPAHFADFYEKIKLGSSTSIAMIGSDGIVRSSGGHPSGKLELGLDVSGTAIARRMRGDQTIIFEEADAFPGDTRLVAMRKVRDQPLWVMVSVDKSDVFVRSFNNLQAFAAAGFLLTILILAAMERVLRSEAKRSEAEANVARLAAEDPLTGLPNRRVFRSVLDGLCREADAESSAPETSQPFAVLFLDLDRFKIVNDTLGHRIGDLLLLKLAKRLERCLEYGQSLARLGGDEFALVVTGNISRERLKALATSLSEAVCEPFEVDGHQIRTSVSIGIAVALQDGKTADELLMASDLALYSVKANGRGTYRFFDRSMNEEVTVRRQIEGDLRDAIEREDFELHYQPILDVGRKNVTGFEALVRWRHPQRGLIPPSLFIPIAEETGLIIPIGDWVLREACRTASAWPERLKVAINLSAVQFTLADLAEQVERILQETGLAPDRLEIEITESVFLDKSEPTLAMLHRLKTLGVRIAMDDFGTGYSSLSYLQSFPFDKIKVDRSFVAQLGPDTKHLVIIQAIVSIARGLNMTTTAEGVETDSQLKLLEALGCNEFQGYLVSAPVTKDKIPAVLAGRINAEASMAA